MPITFYDGQEAKKYSREKKEEGYMTLIAKPQEGTWKVYLLKKGHRKESEKELIKKGIKPEHIISYFRPFESSGFDISLEPKIELTSEPIPPHILAAHELAHQKLHHSAELRDTEGEIKQEEEAWNLAAQYLKSGNEWNKEAKEIASHNLASYYHRQRVGKEEITSETGEEDLEKARTFIENL